MKFLIAILFLNSIYDSGPNENLSAADKIVSGPIIVLLWEWSEYETFHCIDYNWKCKIIFMAWSLGGSLGDRRLVPKGQEYHRIKIKLYHRRIPIVWVGTIANMVSFSFGHDWDLSNGSLGMPAFLCQCSIVIQRRVLIF